MIKLAKEVKKQSTSAVIALEREELQLLRIYIGKAIDKRASLGWEDVSITLGGEEDEMNPTPDAVKTVIKELRQKGYWVSFDAINHGANELTINWS